MRLGKGTCWLVGGATAGAVLAAAVLMVIHRGKPAGDEQSPEPLPPPAEVQLTKGKQLYESYCTQCHGEKGAGNGPAAFFLYPKPRNFGEAKFRLATTLRKMPTEQDLLRVITQGMPGSAMFPFAHLAQSDRLALAEYVQELTRQGVRERFQAEAGEEVDPADLEKRVTRYLQPGVALALPAELAGTSPESVARGSQIFREAGCVSCHGQTGKGDGVQEQRDDSGMPIWPRDFTRGIFKGGRAKEQIYARILLGMPGTPMPSSPQIEPARVADLVNFVLSLSEPNAHVKVEHRRSLLIASAAAGPLTDTIDDSVWKTVPAVSVVVSPLWWRSYTPPDLQVQALHDGKSLALRLTWQDSTPNEQAVRPRDFEDMAAAQLFKGTPEPFLGMGTTDKPVDVWLWNPSGQAQPADFADVDTVYPNLAVDMYPFELPGNGPRAHAPTRQPRQFMTARAAGNPRADPERGFTGSSLKAKGFGSATMRPRLSQNVSARGAWQDGRWTVVLRRPLQPAGADGVALTPGDKLSIAFAIWDGAAGDRNGQKLVSVWQDLEVK